MSENGKFTLGYRLFGLVVEVLYLFIVSLHVHISYSSIYLNDVVRGPFGQGGSWLALGILDIFLDKGNGQNLFFFGLAIASLSCGIVHNADVKQGIELLEGTRVNGIAISGNAWTVDRQGLV